MMLLDYATVYRKSDPDACMHEVAESFIPEFVKINESVTEDCQGAVTAALANRALYVSGIRRMTKNEITAVAMIRNAGASSSPVRSTSQLPPGGQAADHPRVTL